MRAIYLIAALMGSMLVFADSAKTDFPVEILGDLNGMTIPRTSAKTTGGLIKLGASVILGSKAEVKAKRYFFQAIGELLEIVDKDDFTQLARDYGYEIFSGSELKRKVDISGFYNADGAPTMNDAVSRVCNICLGPIGNTKDDLDDILDLNWYDKSFELALSALGQTLFDFDLYIDRGDVTMIEAMLEAAKGALYLLRGMDLDMTYEEMIAAITKLSNDFGADDLDLVAAFDASPFARFKVKSMSDLQAARAAFVSAIALAEEGDELVLSRTDGLEHLIQYDTSDFGEIVQFLQNNEKTIISCLDQFMSPADISGGEVEVDALEFTYTGSTLAPTVGTLTVAGEALPYDLSGATNATEIGTYEMTLVGYGRSTGTKTVVWKIVEPPPSRVVFDLAGHGTRTGGGALEQMVAWKAAAQAPEFVPEVGYRFLGWDRPFDSVAGELTVTAQWEQIKYAVDIDGDIANDCVYGQEVTAATFASMTNGWTNIVCVGWIGTGDVPASGVGTQVAFTVTQPSMLRWQYATNYWVNVFGTAGGSVMLTDDAGAEVPSRGWFGDETNLVALATPDTGYRLVRWGVVVDDGAGGWTRVSTLGTQTSQPLRVSAPWNVRAEFAECEYRVVFDVGLHGIRTGGGQLVQSVKHGMSAAAPTVSAKAGYRFVGWDGEFGSVAGELHVTAQYEMETYQISYADDKGCANGNPIAYTVEDAVTFSALTNPPGWCFLGWEPASIPAGTTGELTVTAQWEDARLPDGGPYTETVDGIAWTFVVTNGEASVGGGSYGSPAISTSTTGAITIPSALGGYPVTSIGDFAFLCCDGLTSVMIPSSVTSIGEWAFYYCSGLTSVTIPEGVTSIGGSAFSYCIGLKSITIPSSVTSIGKWAFYACSGLMRFSVDEANPSYKSVNGLLLAKDGKTLIGGINGVVTIPSSVTSIGAYAFRYCDGLTSVAIPSSVTSIGERAFSNCHGLTSVTIPSSVMSIGEGAFAYGRGRTNFSVDEANPSYKSVSGLLLTKDGKTLIGGVNRVVAIPSSVTSIGGFAFSGFSGLTSVAIPSSVTSIGRFAFGDCSGLTSVAIPSSVTSIGEGAFQGCIGLTSVAIPSSVTSIGEDAFSYCSGLKTVWVDAGDADRVQGMLEGSGLDCSGIDLVDVSVEYVLRFNSGEGSGEMPQIICETNKVYSLSPNGFVPPKGKAFAGWQCSNGKRYDDGMLVFNLAEPGETVTMTAIWE